MLYRISAYLGTSCSLFLKKNVALNSEHEKRIHYLSKDGIEKSVPHNHQLSSFWQASRWEIRVRTGLKCT